MTIQSRSDAAVIKRITGSILLLSLATIFIWSGWTKLQTIEPFSWSFIDILPVGITAASIVARIFIGLEWLIGAWLAAHLFLRKITYKATIGLLLLLTAYLALLIVRQGNTGNCGCFGEWLYMKPAGAIWKNVALIAAVVVLWVIYPAKSYSYDIYIALALAAAAFSLPFVLEPVYVGNGAEVVHESIDLQPLYAFGSPKPTVDLAHGRHIICYFSTTCPHCKKAAYLVQILHRHYPEFPIFMALNGSPVLQQSFLAESKAGDVPHTLMANTIAFTSMAGRYVPAIFWVNNSIIERRMYYTALEPGAIKAWLKGK